MYKKLIFPYLKQKQLARAIELKTKLSLESKNNHYTCKEYGTYFDIISIDENIDIVISSHHFDDNNYSLEFDYYYGIIKIVVDIYINKIKTVQYDFEKKVVKDDIKPYLWITGIKKKNHQLPKAIVKEINNWSRRVLQEENVQKQLEKQKKKKQFLLEEEKIEKANKMYQ